MAKALEAAALRPSGERTEAVIECELSALQRRLYRGIAEAARRDVLADFRAVLKSVYQPANYSERVRAVGGEASISSAPSRRSNAPGVSLGLP